jgi:threonine/homoserine/homoserine lactone efflux protein
MPIDTSLLPVFVTASFVLLATPGPAVLYTVTRSIEQGRLAGFVAVTGITAGGLILVIVTSLGLAALLAATPMALSAVRYAGAAYFFYVAARILFVRSETVADALPYSRLNRLFWEGILVNTLNPKAILIFLAFIPQFVVPELGRVSLQVFVLGLIFITIGIVSDAIYVLGASTIRNRVSNSPKQNRVIRYWTGSVFFLLGLFALLS